MVMVLKVQCQCQGQCFLVAWADTCVLQGVTTVFFYLFLCSSEKEIKDLELGYVDADNLLPK